VEIQYKALSVYYIVGGQLQAQAALLAGKIHWYPLCRMGRKAQSLYRLATGWMVRGSNPGGARFSASVQTGPGAHQPPIQKVPGLFRG
jgi:hypothetical protein